MCSGIQIMAYLRSKQSFKFVLKVASKFTIITMNLRGVHQGLPYQKCLSHVTVY